MKSVYFLFKVSDPLKSYITKKLEPTSVNLIFSEDPITDIWDHLHKINVIVGWQPTIEMLVTENILYLINPGAGVQHLVPLVKDANSKRHSKLTLINNHGNAYFTAQSAVSLLLSVMCKVVLHHNWMNSGLWRRGDDFAKSIPLKNQTIGLFGYGSVNRLVHQFLSGFDVKFVALKRELGSEGELTVYTPDQLHQFLKIIDILIIAAPLTMETIDLIGTDELSLLGTNGIIINMGRGKIINENALYLALKHQTIQAAGIDVWYNYDPEENDGRKYPYSYPFHKLNNVVLSPHRGASPMDDLERWDDIIMNLNAICSDEANLMNVVDLEKEY
ncbi:MAG: hypothetical protein OEZ01_05600 [Candidatus Heimdallarchaeota archaeon]|nr:hypothetical protein [Candidatus Heimdallarchaeota archaeon]MDH5645459.1 hypothetical protein [Candidatus Heimdallarchaeota archaeon]